MAAPIVPYVDDPSCRDVFSDGSIVAVDPVSQIVRLEFFVNRFSATANVTANRVSPVARVALTRAAAEALVAMLRQNLAPPTQTGSGRA
jgi:hypothetical protein